MSITKDKAAHTIVVERVDEENGEIDWYVEHPPGCPIEEFNNDFDAKYEPMTYHVCTVQSELDYIGLESLADMLELDNEYQIPLGRHQVIAVIAYDSYTHEGEVWFEKPTLDI